MGKVGRTTSPGEVGKPEPPGDLRAGAGAGGTYPNRGEAANTNAVSRESLIRAILEADVAELAARDRHELAPLEASATNALAMLWATQGTRFLAALGRHADEWPNIPRSLVEAAFTASESLSLWDQFLAVRRRAYVAGIHSTAEDVGIIINVREAVEFGGVTFGMDDPRVQAFLDTEGGKLIRNVDETTRKAIMVQIRAATTAGGLSWDEAARRIAQRYAAFATPSPLGHIRSRAELVAATEINNAHGESRLQSGRLLAAAGLQVEKFWQNRGDNRVDDLICRRNTSAGWIGLEDEFPSGVDRPSGHPGCRCSLLVRRHRGGEGNADQRAADVLARAQRRASRPDVPRGNEIQHEVETRIRQLATHEEAYAFKDGVQVLAKGGGAADVQFTDAELAQMKDAILTHNHPRGLRDGLPSNSFSGADWFTGTGADVAEIRAVAYDFTYSVTRPAGGWPSREAMQSAYNRADAGTKGDFWPRISNGTMTKAEASATHFHEVALRMARELGLDYRRTPYTP